MRDLALHHLPTSMVLSCSKSLWQLRMFLDFSGEFLDCFQQIPLGRWLVDRAPMLVVYGLFWVNNHTASSFQQPSPLKLSRGTDGG
ncbi:hypothetical protein TSUD_248520 [Trifolium subterraneum]|uniref:Uncharacterized protein n=1 Tax=Trifolium subterraneum TaxID=3900 RepID=A0A2Z6LP96_TRISU|nr:hypothetical protein TSUD_248520 [Trifolium subterraneum]